MRKEVERKMKTIQASSSAEFDAKYNEASKELSIVEEEWEHWSNGVMCVHLIYTKEKLVPESLEEEFKLRGEHYYCKDCPFFKKGKNKRCKSVGCKYSPYGTAADFNPACEYFYKQLINGKIGPVED